MRPGNLQISEQRSDGLAGHRRAPIGVHNLRYTVHREDLLHQFLGQHTGFVGMDVGTDDVAGVDVDHHVRIEVAALPRARELGDVPAVHLLRRGRDQLRAHLGRVPRQPAAFGDQGVLSQHPVHRGHRTQVHALVEQLSVDLQRCQIGEPVTVEHFQDPAPFPISQLVDRGGRCLRRHRGRGAVAARSRRVAVERTIAVNTAAAWSRHQRRSATHRRASSLLGCSSESALSEESPRERVLFP